MVLWPESAPELKPDSYTIKQLRKLCPFAPPFLWLYNLEEDHLDTPESTDQVVVYCWIERMAGGVRLLGMGRQFAATLRTHDLRAFPFDTQQLQIQVRSSSFYLVHHTAADRAATSIKDELNVLAEWKARSPHYWFTLHNHRKPVAVMSLEMKRRAANYVKNIICMTSLILISSLCTFATGVDDWENRSGILFTLLLTMVAFKLLAADMLPRVPYDTFLDKVMLSEFAVLLAMTFVSALLVRHGDEDDDTIYFWICVAVLSVFHLVMGVWARVLARRKPGLRSDRRRIHDMVVAAREANTLAHLHFEVEQPKQPPAENNNSDSEDSSGSDSDGDDQLEQQRLRLLQQLVELAKSRKRRSRRKQPPQPPPHERPQPPQRTHTVEL